MLCIKVTGVEWGRANMFKNALLENMSFKQ